MTVDEIKSTYSMRMIAEKYGLHPNKKGFCICPFHSEKTASFKIYADSFYCFGCGASGDIFSFVQKMDNISFREAFLMLGGSYEKNPSFSSRLSIYQAKKAREKEEKERLEAEREKDTNNFLITFYRQRMSKSKPLSEEWCSAFEALNKQLRRHACLNDLPY